MPIDQDTEERLWDLESKLKHEHQELVHYRRATRRLARKETQRENGLRLTFRILFALLGLSSITGGIVVDRQDTIANKRAAEDAEMAARYERMHPGEVAQLARDTVGAPDREKSGDLTPKTLFGTGVTLLTIAAGIRPKEEQDDEEDDGDEP